jgi:hypothetical protein
MRKIRIHLACLLLVAALGAAALPAAVRADNAPQSGGDGTKKPRCNPICIPPVAESEVSAEATAPPVAESETSAEATAVDSVIYEVISWLI